MYITNLLRMRNCMLSSSFFSAELLQKLIILDQHFQPNNPSPGGRNSKPSGSPGKPLKKSNSNAAKEAGKLETFVSLDKSKGSSSGIANQTELLEKIVVLDRLQDGRSVRINSTIANMSKWKIWLHGIICTIARLPVLNDYLS